MVFNRLLSAAGNSLRWLDDKSDASSHMRRQVQLVDTADWVVFDFSAWDVRELNYDSTSYLIGLADGVLHLTFSRRGQVDTIACESTSMLPAMGRDIIWIYRWCREHAPGAGRRQRVFRFEKGRHVAEASHLRVSLEGFRPRRME